MATTLVRKVMLRIAADDGDTESKLDKISAKADELAAKHPDLKVKIDTAAASAKLAALRTELKRTDDEARKDGGSGGGLRLLGQALNTGLLGGISTNIGEMSMFGKVMAGLNLATGLAEPLVAGLTVAVGGLGAGLVAGGLGLGVFGLVAKSTLTSAATAATAVQNAQTAYNSAIATGTKHSTAYAAEQKAILTAYAQLSPAQIQLSKNIGNAQNTWQSFVQSNTAGVSKIVSQGIGLLPKVLASMQPFLAPVEGALKNILNLAGQGLGSSGFKSWIGAFAAASGPALNNIAVSIGHIVVGLGGVLRAFLPMSGRMTVGLAELTSKFAHWGTTLTSHSGFQSLMAMFKQDTPIVVGLLGNLAGILKTVIGQMTGMNTASNSRTLIQVAEALSGLVNGLLKAHPQLVTYILYAKLAADTSKQLFGGIKSVADGLGSLKTGAKAVSDFSAGFGDAKKAADEATGAAGTYGGKISTVLQRLGLLKVATAEATAATEGETVAQEGLDVAMEANPIGLVIVAVVALAAVFYELWKHFAGFRDFWKAAWHDVLVVVDAAVGFIRDHWKLLSVILGTLLLGPIGGLVIFMATHLGMVKKIVGDTVDWIRAHWKLLAAIILGPLGLIIDALATHWSAVEHGFEAAYKFVAGIVSKGIDFIKNDVIAPYVKWNEAIFRAGWDAVKAVFQAVWGFIRPFVVLQVNAVKFELSWFSRLAGLFLGWWLDAAKAVGTGIGKLLGFVASIPGRVNSALGGLPGMMYNAGIHVIENLIDGIMSQVGSLGSVMGGVASKVAGFFGLSPAKEGPLSAGGAPFIRGQHFALDIAAGMKAALPAVSASSAHVARAAAIASPGHPGYGTAGAGAQRMQLELNITGGNAAFRTFLKKSIRTTGGDVSVVGA